MKPIINKIIKVLNKKKLKISVAESCTGGLLSSAITSVGGSSKVFTFGLVTYSNQSKIKFLKVPKKLINKYGAVSKECCEAMLRGLNKINKTDISLSITGVAGPNGSSKKKPVGLVYIGLKNINKILIKKCLFKNNGRSYIQKTAVNEALRIILKSIK